MLAQVHCLVLVVLVAGVLCAPSPNKFRIGVSHFTSGTTGVDAGGKVKGALNGKLADGKVSGKVGLTGSADVDGSTYVQYNGKIVEAAGDYHASGAAKTMGSLAAHGGQNANGQLDFGAKGNSISSAEESGAGGVGINTDQDALSKYYEHKQRTAEKYLKDMENEDY